MPTPKVWTFSVCYNEARMSHWFVRHYSPWVDRMVIWVEPSTDGTEEILRSVPNSDVRPYPYRGLDDNRFLEAVNGWYQEARGKADWVAWVDMDELLYHPNILDILEKTDADVLPATGYAIISPSGWPDSKAKGQLYELVRTGLRQTNFDKKLLFRSSINMTHTFGRHTYQDWPKHNGKESPDVGIKLLHCHHVGGIEDTAQRNRRNYARALDKKFAWNYAAGPNDDPNQSGSVAWVKNGIEKDLLIDVMSGEKVLKKLHFGTGAHSLPGWTNTDLPQVDIRKRLPYEDRSASHIYASHVVEHVTHAEAWNFFTECYRVLAPKGKIRIAIPDITKMNRDMTEEYQQAVKNGGHGDGSKQSALKAAVFCHGHQAAWNSDLLMTFMEAVGFNHVSQCEYGQSKDPELRGIEQHGKVVGEDVAKVETSIVEGTKL